MTKTTGTKTTGTKRSNLFASVALPLLAATIAVQPAFADSLMKPYEVAQDSGEQVLDQPVADGEGQPEELPRKRRNREPAAEDSQQSGDAEQAAPSREERKRRAAEEVPQDEQPSAEQAQEEQPAPIERKRRKQQDAGQQQEPQAEEQAQPSADDEAARQAAEQQAAEEKQKARAERRKAQHQAEEQSSEQPAEAQPAPEKKRKKRQDAEQQQEQQPEEQAQPSADDDAARQAAEQQAAEEKAAEDKAKARAERRKKAAEEQQAQQPDSEQPVPEAKPRNKKESAEQAVTPSDDGSGEGNSAGDRKRKRDEQKARDAANGDSQDPAAVDGALRPTIDGDTAEGNDGQRPRDRRKPLPEVTDTLSEQEKEAIAQDPSKTDETVVLPVENGAAVLDSDKDADNSGGDQAREKRRKQREQVREEDDNVEVPKTDAEAQSRHDRDKRPSREEIGAAINERGRRVEEVPEFGLGDLLDAVTGNAGRRPRVEEERDNRYVIDTGDQIIVRSDDRPRLRRNAEQSYYEELPRGRTREVIERPGGIRIVTIYNRYGDIIQRSRIDDDGREYLMIYAPEADEGPRPPVRDVGDELPPMRLRVPVQDYIIDTSSEPDRDYYDFLAEPPVEQVRRVYTVDEVKNSARVRDMVRRIDLDTITFATGSSEVPLSQAKTLRKVADAILEVIEKDPGETFLIEGHTDAVGSDQSNLILSDERAESVASLLSEVYDIPPENLVTQGYGERFLKVRTQEAEQQNRRVTIRRVTPLVRPVARN